MRDMLGMGEYHYLLSDDVVDEIVNDWEVGNYAYGYLDEGKNFVVKYIGRSFEGLADEIKNRKNSLPFGDTYTHFKLKRYVSVENAYYHECNNFHDYGEADGLDNEIHPAHPDSTKYPGLDLKCPQLYADYHKDD